MKISKKKEITKLTMGSNNYKNITKCSVCVIHALLYQLTCTNTGSPKIGMLEIIFKSFIKTCRVVRLEISALALLMFWNIFSALKLPAQICCNLSVISKSRGWAIPAVFERQAVSNIMVPMNILVWHKTIY